MSQAPSEHEAIDRPDISRERLKEIWCELNRFEVPREMREIDFKVGGQAWGAMLLIQSLIPKREILETWNRTGKERKHLLPEGQIAKEKPRG